ncbi:uncharacterized protein LOC111600667 isoform X2 [Drosophila hydei]|uniref:Uncharacterized protein LOC111600667 isoform X2 n=1 Tax=Drosophila hydei TaxID=7224 RepID=A0A6J1LWQ4_DROHY|nr:uncharacterized protein LOC111600667 isoform X2 [Drosophila hydei]
MHFQQWAAFLLLAWIGVPGQIQAARTISLKQVQYLQPQMQTPKKSGTQIAYPKYSFVPSRFPSDRHNPYLLSGQPKAAPTTTTERPFVRVWNNFLRSVQPNFGLRNLTNPLVNLFNNGVTNLIETVPVPAQIYNDEQQEDEVQQSSAAVTQNAKKRKRKRRKQQKHRPIYDSQELNDPYDYYGTTLHQPMYYYGPNDYYGVRRVQSYADYPRQLNYYDHYFQDNSVTGDVSQYTAEESLGKRNTKNYAVLRPLTLTIQLPSGETTHDEPLNDSVANENTDETYVVVGTNTEGNVDSAPNAASSDDRVPLSESVRNAFGTYMHDDIDNRERQRQPAHQRELAALAKSKPRQQQRYLFAARLVNNHK